MVLGGDSTISITLSGGHIVILDADDLERVSAIKWHFHLGYARGTIEGKKTYMHRLISGAGPEDICDHKNGVKLDNRKANIRLTDKYGNSRNRTTNGYIGVTKSAGKFNASIVRGSRTYYLGRYVSEKLAAFAVDLARIQLDGELLRPNVPDFSPTTDERQIVDRAIARAARGPKAVKARAKGRWISPQTRERIRGSKLSNQYWSKRLNLSLATVIAIREPS